MNTRCFRAAVALLAAYGCAMAPINTTPVDLATMPGSEGYITTDDSVQLHYRVLGSGPDTAIVLQGGPGLPLDYLLPDMAPLARRHVLIMFDPRGSGLSTLVRDTSRLRVERMIGDVDAVREHFKLENVALVGHDWGALVAAFYAYLHPERIARLLMFAAFPPVRDRFEIDLGARLGLSSRRRLDSLALAWRSASDPVASCRAFWRTLLPAYFVDGEAIRDMKGDACQQPRAALVNEAASRYPLQSIGRWDLTRALGDVIAPVLVMQGAADVIPRASAAAWTCAFPSARMLEFDDVGHFPQVEVPAEFFPAADAFLHGKSVDHTTSRESACSLLRAIEMGHT